MAQWENHALLTLCMIKIIGGGGGGGGRGGDTFKTPSLL